MDDQLPQGNRRHLVTYLFREPVGVDGERLYGQQRDHWRRIHAEMAEEHRLNREALTAHGGKRLVAQARRVHHLEPHDHRLGRNCRRLRLRAGYRIGAAASSLGLYLSRLTRMERGDAPVPAVLLPLMAALYSARLEEFFEGITVAPLPLDDQPETLAGRRPPPPAPRLDPDVVAAIRREYRPYKVTVAHLAAKYGVNYHTVESIVRGRRWANTATHQAGEH